MKNINQKALRDIETQAAATLNNVWREIVYSLVDEIRLLREAVIVAAKENAKRKVADYIRNQRTQEVRQDAKRVLRGMSSESDSVSS